MSDLAIDPRVPVSTAASGRPLRVAHLTTVDVSLAVLLRTELEADVERGVETYGLSAPGPFVGEVEALGVRHIPLAALTRSWDPVRDVVAIKQLASALRETRPDVLHTHNPKTGVMGRIVGRVVGVPVVVNTCHGLWATTDDSRRKRMLVHGAEAVAAAFSDAELYQNAQDRQSLNRWVRQSKTWVVGNGTDLRTFAPDPSARDRVRAELGLDDDTVLVGGIGRLVAEKGLREFELVARALRGRAVFVWAGRHDLDKSDAVAVTDGAVRFLGHRNDMAAVHNAFDVFVLPSYREGFSRSAMEAAATGTSMVLSDIRGCREIGRHGQEVLLVPTRDADALRKAVERLIDDAQLRARLGDAARRRALAQFDQRAVAAASWATYRSVAERKCLGWKCGDDPL